MPDNPLARQLRVPLADPVTFTYVNSGIRLRTYQEGVARAVIDSIVRKLGLSFVVMFPRQSGKNELQAQLEAYLLTVFCLSGAEMIKISPTWRPQSLNAMYRLETILNRGTITGALWQKENSYIYRMQSARISFLSGETTAHIVGATASTLLEVDEAQDVWIAKYDKEIAPMAASTNATRVFWGTAWTDQTLLARELRLARSLEEQDGVQRVFLITADEVAREVPPYGDFVREQVARLGRSHPMVRSQFYSEEVDSEVGMFPAARREQMQGQHAWLPGPQTGQMYAFLLDVGGEAAGSEAGLAESSPAYEHDSTALTIVQVDLTCLSDPLLQAPIYRVVHRRVWTGTSQPDLYAEIKCLMETWKPRRVIVDSTGIGAGLAAFLQKLSPSRVKPFLFTASSKSNLGWSFLSVCDTGRFLDYSLRSQDDEQQIFWRQVSACQMETDPGPSCRIHWGVPDSARDHASCSLIHDDLLLSASLCALLDEEKWHLPDEKPVWIRASDPLTRMEKGF